jgi:RND family efflux transporter MFP subunit
VVNEALKFLKIITGKWRALPERRKRKVLAGAAFLALLFWLGLRGKAKQVHLEPADVTFLAGYTDHVQCTTRPRSIAETFLSVQHGGRLDRLLKKSGDPVKAGDIIAVVDETANAAGLKSALSAFRHAQADDGRIASLYRSGAVTREEFDATRSRLDVKRAELEQARQKVEDGIVRSPVDGVLATIVFKTGDKVPDGGRVAAVEDPDGTQATCRVSSESADILAKSSDERTSIWTVIDTNPPLTVEVPVRVTVLQTEGGFRGLDVDVRIESKAPQAKQTAGKLTEIKLPLQERSNVTKIPSLAVIRRQGGSFVVIQRANGAYSWQRISILNQTAQDTIAADIPVGARVFLLKDDPSKIEALIK